MFRRIDSLSLMAVFSLMPLAACATTGLAQSRAPAPELAGAAAPTFADLADLALAGRTVAVVQVDDQTTFPPERSAGVAPGSVRLYVESVTQRLLAGPNAIGSTLNFVVDRPRNTEGDPPRLKRQSFIVFGDGVAARPGEPQRPGEFQLASSKGMLPFGPIIEGRVRDVLTQVAARDALPAIAGVRDVISVPGNLAGEAETQLTLATTGRTPISLSVVRRPSMAPTWGVSTGEIVSQNARPPQPNTIAWYRLACFLPRELPDSAFLQSDRESRDRARQDYAFVLRELGPCERHL